MRSGQCSGGELKEAGMIGSNGVELRSGQCSGGELKEAGMIGSNGVELSWKVLDS